MEQPNKKQRVKVLKKKKCPGCAKLFDARYMRKHIMRNKHGNNWACAKSVSADIDGNNSQDSNSLHVDNQQQQEAMVMDDSNGNAECANVIHDEILPVEKVSEKLDTSNVEQHKELSDDERDDDYCTPSASSDDETDIDDEEDSVDEQCYNEGTDESENEEPMFNKAPTDDSLLYKYITSSLCSFMTLFEATFKIPNNATIILLQYLKCLLQKIMLLVRPEDCKNVNIPTTIHSLWKSISYQRKSFTKYAVCTECFALYPLDKCIIRIEGQFHSKLCTNICFPDHPTPSNRSECGNELVTVTITSNGKPIITAKKLYCFKSIREYLTTFVKRRNYVQNCEAYNSRTVDDNYLSDVYDGNIWKEFKKNGFFQLGDLALMINVDWFRPFKHTQYSIGVIYGVILNLPRELRYLEENVMVIGILPHITPEPPLNSFLKPLIDELLEAWDPGFFLNTYENVTQVLFI